MSKTKYMDKIELIKSLGWRLTQYWNNRAIYVPQKYPTCNYCLFEHQGNIGIIYNGDFHYYDLATDDIKDFTEILFKREELIKAENILRMIDKNTLKNFIYYSENLESILDKFETTEEL